MKFCKKASSIVFTRGRKLVAYYTINIFYPLSDHLWLLLLLPGTQHENQNRPASSRWSPLCMQQSSWVDIMPIHKVCEYIYPCIYICIYCRIDVDYLYHSILNNVEHITWWSLLWCCTVPPSRLFIMLYNNIIIIWKVGTDTDAFKAAINYHALLAR